MDASFQKIWPRFKRRINQNKFKIKGPFTGPFFMRPAGEALQVI